MTDLSSFLQLFGVIVLANVVSFALIKTMPTLVKAAIPHLPVKKQEFYATLALAASGANLARFETHELNQPIGITIAR